MLTDFDAFKFNKFGPTLDPRGAHVLTKDDRLLEIIGIKRHFVSGARFWVTRHFNGEIGPDVPFHTARVLERR